ncbi:hypothetical protein B0H17DRAFT_1127300 [Mycena rosella]|uniref:Uncharacterized protein n=1 Tax=Mycena rosella TaxID=1033263 RepID=A0AAD7M6F7_MYCRO|nr:hypothetical protein B0H17DRAFT_1127300 [Mycena rosella]
MRPPTNQPLAFWVTSVDLWTSFLISAPPPSPYDQKIERILLQTVLWEARQKGGSLLQDCLQDLWEKANLVRARGEGFSEGKEAGFKEGVESGRGTTEASDTAVFHEKALEAEQVWGYDVGWKLFCEMQKSHALQASPIPPFPRSLSVTATQTDDIAVTSVIPAAAAAAPAPTPAPLDWAEDAATLPIFPSCFPAPPSIPRDFSVLRTSSPQPFASL